MSFDLSLHAGTAVAAVKSVTPSPGATAAAPAAADPAGTAADPADEPAADAGADAAPLADADPAGGCAPASPDGLPLRRSQPAVPGASAAAASRGQSAERITVER